MAQEKRGHENRGAELIRHMHVLETLGCFFGGNLRPEAYRQQLADDSTTRNPRDPKVSWEAIRRGVVTYEQLAEGLRVEFGLRHWTTLDASELDLNTAPILQKSHEWSRLHYVFGRSGTNGPVRVAVADTEQIPLTQQDLTNYGKAELFATPLYIVARNIFEDPRRWMHWSHVYANNVAHMQFGGHLGGAAPVVAGLERMIARMGSHTVVRTIAGHLRRLANEPMSAAPGGVSPFAVCQWVIHALAAATPLLTPSAHALVGFTNNLTVAATPAAVIQCCNAAIISMDALDFSTAEAVVLNLLRRQTKPVAFYGASATILHALSWIRPDYPAFVIAAKDWECANQQQWFHEHHSRYPDWVTVVPHPTTQAEFAQHRIDKLVFFPTTASATYVVAEDGVDDLITFCRNSGSEVHAVLSKEKYSLQWIGNTIHRLGYFESVNMQALSGYWIVG